MGLAGENWRFKTLNYVPVKGQLVHDGMNVRRQVERRRKCASRQDVCDLRPAQCRATHRHIAVYWAHRRTLLRVVYEAQDAHDSIACFDSAFKTRGVLRVHNNAFCSMPARLSGCDSLFCPTDELEVKVIRRCKNGLGEMLVVRMWVGIVVIGRCQTPTSPEGETPLANLVHGSHVRIMPVVPYRILSHATRRQVSCYMYSTCCTRHWLQALTSRALARLMHYSLRCTPVSQR